MRRLWGLSVEAAGLSSVSPERGSETKRGDRDRNRKSASLGLMDLRDDFDIPLRFSVTRAGDAKSLARQQGFLDGRSGLVPLALAGRGRDCYFDIDFVTGGYAHSFKGAAVIKSSRDEGDDDHERNSPDGVRAGAVTTRVMYDLSFDYDFIHIIPPKDVITTRITIPKVQMRVCRADYNGLTAASGNVGNATYSRGCLPYSSNIQGGTVVMSTANQDRVEGKWEQAKGWVKDKAGEVTGDRSLEAEGEAQRAAGEGQETWGKFKKGVGDAVEAVGDAIKR